MLLLLKSAITERNVLVCSISETANFSNSDTFELLLTYEQLRLLLNDNMENELL